MVKVCVHFHKPGHLPDPLGEWGDLFREDAQIDATGIRLPDRFISTSDVVTAELFVPQTVLKKSVRILRLHLRQEVVDINFDPRKLEPSELSIQFTERHVRPTAKTHVKVALLVVGGVTFMAIVQTCFGAAPK